MRRQQIGKNLVMAKRGRGITLPAAAGIGGVVLPAVAIALGFAWIHLHPRPEFLVSRQPVWTATAIALVLGPPAGVFVRSLAEGRSVALRRFAIALVIWAPLLGAYYFLFQLLAFPGGLLLLVLLIAFMGAPGAVAERFVPLTTPRGEGSRERTSAADRPDVRKVWGVR